MLVTLNLIFVIVCFNYYETYSSCLEDTGFYGTIHLPCIFLNYELLVFYIGDMDSLNRWSAWPSG